MRIVIMFARTLSPLVAGVQNRLTGFAPYHVAVASMSEVTVYFGVLGVGECSPVSTVAP